MPVEAGEDDEAAAEETAGDFCDAGGGDVVSRQPLIFVSFFLFSFCLSFFLSFFLLSPRAPFARDWDRGQRNRVGAVLTPRAQPEISYRYSRPIASG